MAGCQGEWCACRPPPTLGLACSRGPAAARESPWRSGGGGGTSGARGGRRPCPPVAWPPAAAKHAWV
eukprot:12807288-Alexandrium_andersonii.AAC.1